MSFLGITYYHESDENFKEFLDILGIPADIAEAWLNSKPSPKVELEGDIYTSTTTDAFGKTKIVQFQSGVEFEEEVLPGIFANTTYTVDDNVITQVQVYPDGRFITYKRVYDGDELVVDLTASSWDGLARRYYKAE